MSERNFFAKLFLGRKYNKPERKLPKVPKNNTDSVSDSFSRPRVTNSALKYKGKADPDKMAEIRALRKKIKNGETFVESKELDSFRKYFLDKFANVDFSQVSLDDAKLTAQSLLEEVIDDFNKVKLDQSKNDSQVMFRVRKNVQDDFKIFIVTAYYEKGIGFRASLDIL